MKTNVRTVALGAALLALAPASFGQYNFELLKPGAWNDNSSKAEGGINNAGVVAGFSSSGGNWRDTAVRWITDTPAYQTLPAPYESRGNAFNYSEDIDSQGNLAGYTFDGLGWTDSHIFPIWWDTANTGRSLPGGAGVCHGINDQGVVVGRTLTEAFLWKIGDAAQTLLGNPAGGSLSDAQDISESGLIVVGSATIGGVKRACRWQSGAWTVLANPSGATQAIAYDVLDDGTVFGNAWSTDSTKTRGVRWDSLGNPTDLGTLGGLYTTVYGANRKGDVVGMSTTASGESRPFLLPAGGSMIDLKDAFAAAGWVVFRLMDVNDSGALAGYGYYQGGAKFQSFRATPSLPWLRGTISLTDFVGALPTQVTVEFRQPGTTNVVKSVVCQLGSGGKFEAQAPSKAAWDASVKVSHWLRRTSQFDFSTGDIGGASLSLVNGDVDDDNAVTAFDYNALSDAFDTAEGDPNWNANADLDGDGAVTVFDYNVLSANFDQVGDD